MNFNKEEVIERFKDKVILVICGGTSGEKEVSIRSGRNVYKALKHFDLNVKLLEIEKDFVKEILDARPFDVVFNILHGKPGEDGTVQGFLELLSIPYTGSSVLGSAIGMNKIVAKKIFITEGIPTPPFVTVYHYENFEEKLKEAEEKFGYPMMFKPKDEGSSLGVAICRNREDVIRNFYENENKFKDFFLEKYIKGKIITTGILGTGKNAFALPILELRPVRREFYDYTAKYTKGETEFILPAQLSPELTDLVQNLSLKAHLALECRGFSRVDGVISENGEPYILEVNTLPGMTDLSDLPAEAKAYGLTYEELVLFILNTVYD
ncbi:MAG: D-alanine--D-alanine ligase [Candidatus Hydrothermales bacterium]